MIGIAEDDLSVHTLEIGWQKRLDAALGPYWHEYRCVDLPMF